MIWRANFINKDWVELETSEMFESPQHKVFMRISAIITDLISFYILLYYYSIKYNNYDKDKYNKVIMIMSLACKHKSCI